MDEDTCLRQWLEAANARQMALDLIASEIDDATQRLAEHIHNQQQPIHNQRARRGFFVRVASRFPHAMNAFRLRIQEDQKQGDVEDNFLLAAESIVRNLTSLSPIVRQINDQIALLQNRQTNASKLEEKIHDLVGFCTAIERQVESYNPSYAKYAGKRIISDCEDAALGLVSRISVIDTLHQRFDEHFTSDGDAADFRDAWQLMRRNITVPIQAQSASPIGLHADLGSLENDYVLLGSVRQRLQSIEEPLANEAQRVGSRINELAELKRGAILNWLELKHITAGDDQQRDIYDQMEDFVVRRMSPAALTL